MSNEVCKNDKDLNKNIEIEPLIKKLKSSIISKHVDSLEFQELFIKHWHNLKPIKTDTIEIITEPYRICKISNFIADDSFLSNIKDELKDVESFRNSMDLYQFEQTKDLANVESKNITILYRIFKSDVVDWMKKNTRISLSGKISMSSASYSDTDYLLCHDDNMGDRKIAFILYLTKNWTPQDGGALDIFDTDEYGQPKNIVRSIIPEYNSLVFFEVLDNSYHQVAEITSSDKLRLSINGWFHGPLRNSNKQPRPEIIYKYFEPEHTEVDLVSYISKIYLYETIVKKIQKTIEKDSFIYLPGFLLPDRYEKLCNEIKNENIKWEKAGPADLQNYEIANEDSLPQVLKEFYNIFKSIHIFHLLKQYTELDLVPEKDDMKPRMKIELQRWTHGCYMLINDKETAEPIKNVEEKMKNNQNYGSTNVNTDSNSKKNVELSVKNKLESIVESVNIETNETISNKDDEEPGPREKIIKNLGDEFRNNVENKSAKGKSIMSMSKEVSSKSLKKKSTLSIESDKSDSSDIEDYLSNPENNSESEVSEENDEEEDAKPGTLDVLLQFHTENVTEDATIDYINPSQKEGALIHIPPQDNHLCLVYRTADTCRCNKYVDHYCKGYFYTLVCSYYE